MTTTEIAGRLSVVQMVMQMDARGSTSTDDLPGRGRALLSILDTIADHPDAERLRALVYVEYLDDHETAHEHFRRAHEAGDAYATGWWAAMRLTNDPTDAGARQMVTDLRGRADGDDAAALVGLSRVNAEHGGETEEDRCVERAAALGDPNAVMSLALNLIVVDPDRAQTLLVPLVAAGEGYASWLMADLDPDNRTDWMRRGAAEGEARCVAWLAHSPQFCDPFSDDDKPERAEADRARALLRDWGLPDTVEDIPDEELSPLAQYGAWWRDLGTNAAQEGEDMRALRAWRTGAGYFGDDDCRHNLGVFLREQAPTQDGPWAIVGTFIRQGANPGPGGPRVGSVEVPLVRMDAPGRPADPWTPWGDSPLAARVVDVLEQHDALVEAIDDDLFHGLWTGEKGRRCDIRFGFTASDDGREQAHVFFDWMIAPPESADAPWGGPDPERHSVGSEVMLPEVPSLWGSPEPAARILLEALVRVGEDDSREWALTPMGAFGLTVGGIMGRRASFDAPLDLQPTPWIATTTTDVINNLADINNLDAHPLATPSPVLRFGYTFGEDLSGSHFSGAVIGSVNALMNLAEWSSLAFDEGPEVFAEFIEAIPLASINDHLACFDIASSTITQRTLLATKTRVRAERGDPFAMNDFGYQLVHSGEVEEGLGWLERSAAAGLPWALATHSWTLLEIGDPRRALDFAERVRGAVDSFIAEHQAPDDDLAEVSRLQRANAYSNLALCSLAVGGSPQDALAVWAEGAPIGHLESRFYPAVIAHQAGDEVTAERILRDLSSEDREALAGDLRQALENAVGWFESWCANAYALVTGQSVDLPLGIPPSRSPASAPPGQPMARFCVWCGTPRAPNDRFCGQCGEELT